MKNEDEKSLEIAKRLKILRKSKGLSVRKVGELLGLSHTAVHQYEKNITKNIPIDTLDKLAKIYDTTLTFLLYGVESNPGALLKTINKNQDLLPYEMISLSPELRTELISLLQADPEFGNIEVLNLTVNSSDERIIAGANYLGLPLPFQQLTFDPWCTILKYLEPTKKQDIIDIVNILVAESPELVKAILTVLIKRDNK